MVGSGKDAPHRAAHCTSPGMACFMNAMMAQTDNDNFAFANNAIRWLGEGPPDGKPHTRALFIRRWRGHQGLRHEANRTVAGRSDTAGCRRSIADSGLGEGALLSEDPGGRAGPSMGRFIAVVLGIVTFLVLLYGAKKFLEGRSHLETAVPALLGPPPTGNAPERAASASRDAQGRLRGAGAANRPRMDAPGVRGHAGPLARGHRCEV